MPRIDPSQLLDCLGVLLDVKGGIRGSAEVRRLTSLMAKFSKKLVSKCIYILILQNTSTELLVEFMAEGGWTLVFQWLDDAIVTNNYSFIQQILRLLLSCPICLDRLKQNNCPKVVKGLSKDSENEVVKQLAGQLVDQWLRFIKSGQAAISEAAVQQGPDDAPSPVPTVSASSVGTVPPVKLSVQPGSFLLSRRKTPHVVRDVPSEEEEEDGEDDEDDDDLPPVGSLPLYKITVRDGKSVLAKVGTKTTPITYKPTARVTGVPSDKIVKKSLSAKIAELGKIPKIVRIEKRGSVENAQPGSSGKDSRPREKSAQSSSVKSFQSKSSKDRDRDRSDSRHREKDRDRYKDRRSDHKTHKSDKHRDQSRHKESSSKDKQRSSEKDKDRLRDKDSGLSKDSKVQEKMSASEKAQMQADRDKDTLERIKTPAISSLGKIPKKQSSLSSSSGAGKTKSGASSPSATDLARYRVKNTVKLFNSKFRSTGLEEEVKQLPAARSSSSKKPLDKSKLDRPKAPATDSSLLGKTHSSVTPKEGPPPEKKSKVAELMESKKADKPGGIKLIPPKPKPALLESDMFSDALTASTKIEPRKRKRRTSSSKDSGPDVKKEKDELGSPEATSPTDVKDVRPALKFYRDTLEDDESDQPLSELKLELKAEKKEPKMEVEEEESGAKLFPRGVLVHLRRRGAKKSVRWKEESELISVRLFELDETERTNVTRTFGDMKLMERSHEREAFQMSRKQPVDDVMEEKTPWGFLHLVDVPSDKQPAVQPGKSSQEKNVQYAREKTILQAIYFHRSAIPDSPHEPDPETHPTTDPKIIPLEDITGNKDSIYDFSTQAWPEPKTAALPSPASPPPMQAPLALHPGYSTVAGFQQPPPLGPPMGAMMGPMQGMQPIQGMPPPQTWRTPDGQEVPMVYPQGGAPMCPPMVPMGPIYTAPPEGFPMNAPMGPGAFPPGYMGGDPNMYGPPPPQWGRGVWQGPPRGPPMKLPKGVCHHFAKFGKCARGNTCRFMHPGVNCPPLT